MGSAALESELSRAGVQWPRRRSPAGSQPVTHGHKEIMATKKEEPRGVRGSLKGAGIQALI
jgi:hypothetical protein